MSLYYYCQRYDIWFINKTKLIKSELEILKKSILFLRYLKNYIIKQSKQIIMFIFFPYNLILKNLILRLIIKLFSKLKNIKE